mgnify:FL=1
MEICLIYSLYVTFSQDHTVLTFYHDVHVNAVAERVYDAHIRKDPIRINGKKLEVELDTPQLSDFHDKMAVRISGISPEMDPDKLKLYLAAISNRRVTDLTYNKSKTRAIARFSQEIGQYTVNVFTCGCSACIHRAWTHFVGVM